MKKLLLLLLLVVSPTYAGPKKFFKHFTGPVADKKFWIVAGGVAAASFLDGYSTQRCVNTGACREHNPLFGDHPSNLRTYGQGAAMTAGEIGLLYWMKRLGHREDSQPNRGKRFYRDLWMYEGFAFTGIHTYAAVHNFRNPTSFAPVCDGRPCQ